jgi:peroxiredoxin Q/BCP
LGLAAGTKAPDFSVTKEDGATVSLADFAGRKLVIFFYPRADTPGCTREAADFSRLQTEFHKVKTELLGISADSVKAQGAFKKKHRLTMALGSDPTHAMLEAYNAWGQKSLYGRSFLGIVRTTYLVGLDGRIAQVWEKVKVPGHAEAVLSAAQGL